MGVGSSTESKEAGPVQVVASPRNSNQIPSKATEPVVRYKENAANQLPPQHPQTTTTTSTMATGSAPSAAKPRGFVVSTSTSTSSGQKTRKGGKRAPRDPSLSVDQRMARALAEQGLVEVGHQPLSGSPRTGSLAVIANSVQSDQRPTRRLKPRAPSSTNSPPARCHSEVMSGASAASGEVVREPVSLRSFEILKVLGRGSHGKVFLVRHRSSGELYAMKQLKKDNVIRQRQDANTRRELRINVLMQQDEPRCPYVVPLRFAFHSRSRLYMVFDFMKGGELYTHLSIRGRLPEVLARFYAAEMALALAALHTKGIIYRDLKPENLLLDAEGHIHLADFGLCQDGIASATEGSDTFAGTCEYLAPEILRYEPHGFAVDYWALGMVVYELLTGLPPFYSYDQQEVVDGILHKELEFPAYVTPEARDLVERLLDRDASKRLGSQRGFDELLEHPFFDAVDWLKLAAREVKPPFTPPHEDDVCNFDPEFTSQRLDAEPDYVPPRKDDPFTGFYFDCEDPVGSSSLLSRVSSDPILAE